jgi:serine/threonine protein kinase
LNDHPDVFELIKGVPRILGLKYTDTVAELKMGYCGESLKSYIQSDSFKRLSPYQKACLAFDMLRQILQPLKILHKALYVHGDIKPDNICVSKL